MITYLADKPKREAGVFTSVARAAGGAARLRLIGLSVRAYPETATRARAALAAAKKQPRSRLGKALKYALIWCQYNWARRYFSQHPEHVAMCWNGITGSRRAFMQGARDAGAARIYAELAPFPGRITLDHTGVNAENSLPRGGEFYRSWAADQPDLAQDGWRALGENLSARASRRADVGQGAADTLHGVGNFLFCPLQVPNDSQITLFAGWVKSVPGMLAALADAAQALPDGWHIRIKEHPSARVSLQDALQQAMAVAPGRIVIDNQTDTFAQVAASDGVITINSSVGLQAFFHDKPVITLGEAFFALPGLVNLADDATALRQLLQTPESLSYDPDLRAAFMNYLDQVYYPRVTETPDGVLQVDNTQALAKLAQARAAASPLSQPGPLR